jgi:uncharacterized repeat protein (TIGR01451 family)
MRHQKFLGLGFILATLIMTFITPQSAQAVAYTVTPSSLAPCGIGRENPVTAPITLGSGLDLVVGPAGAPAGVGSLQAIVPAATDGFAIVCGDASYLGARLDTFTTFSYSTYTDNAVATFSLFINIDYDLTDATTGWQGRLVFEPYQTFTVTPGVWQTWDALAGEWWASGAPGNVTCPQANTCTWAEVLAAYPNAGIHATLGAIGHKAGSGWAGGVVTYVDNLQFATSGGINDSYDYEPLVPTLTLTKTAPATVTEAEIFNYAVTLNNASAVASANNIVIEDILPAGVTYVSDDQADCTEAANTVTCNVLTLATSSAFTVNITVQTVALSGAILSNTATADADELVAPISSNTTNTGVNVVPPVVVVPVDPEVSAVPAPPQCNEPNGDIVAFGLPDGIYCRTLFADGGWRVTAGAIPVELVTAGAIRAVDIYRITGGSVVTGEFGGGVPVCLAGVGRMVFLDASTSPRTQVDIRSFVDGNFTCAFLTHSGTVVLMP